MPGLYFITTIARLFHSFSVRVEKQIDKMLQNTTVQFQIIALSREMKWNNQCVLLYNRNEFHEFNRFCCIQEKHVGKYWNVISFAVFVFDSSESNRMDNKMSTAQSNEQFERREQKKTHSWSRKPLRRECAIYTNFFHWTFLKCIDWEFYSLNFHDFFSIVHCIDRVILNQLK